MSVLDMHDIIWGSRHSSWIFAVSKYYSDLCNINYCHLPFELLKVRSDILIILCIIIKSCLHTEPVAKQAAIWNLNMLSFCAVFSKILKWTKLPEQGNFRTNGIRMSVEAIAGCFPWVDKPWVSRGAGLNLGHLTPACVASSLH